MKKQTYQLKKLNSEKNPNRTPLFLYRDNTPMYCPKNGSKYRCCDDCPAFEIANGISTSIKPTTKVILHCFPQLTEFEIEEGGAYEKTS
jgi:hypothetical protein